MKRNFDDLLDEAEDRLPAANVTIAENVTVPNLFPRITGQPYRIALIGEAPGSDEVAEGKPFVGMSGRFLDQKLSQAQIIRDACFVGNICQVRPPGNKIELFSRSGPEITNGLTQLEKDLNEYQPNICILLGKTALWAAKATDAISDWRGSIFVSDIPGPFYGQKCIAAYHPAACLRQYEWSPLLLLDLRKGLRHATTPTWFPPSENFSLFDSVDGVIGRLNWLKEKKPKVALDIEGYVNAMSCISFAWSATDAFIVPIATRGNNNFYSTAEDEARVWKALTDVLSDPEIPKVLQNSLYDRFVLQYSYGITVRNVVDDTMLKHAELYCELEKSLAFQVSIYTDRPFYKMGRKSEDQNEFWTYCCRDSAVTWEINEKLDKMLDAGQRQHYLFNMHLLNPLLYMELRGFKYNVEESKRRLEQIDNHIYELQTELDKVTGYGFSCSTIEEALSLVTGTMCYKRDAETPKQEFVGTYEKVRDLIRKGIENLTLRDRGYIGQVLSVSLNVASSKQLKTYLYDVLKLPEQWKTDPKTKEKRLTCDYDALLKLRRHSTHPALPLIIDIGELLTRKETLEHFVDPDGRMRCGYNVVGTETVRLSCYASPSGSGFNLQTVPDTNTMKPEGHLLRPGMRDLFMADEDCWLAQCDLKGADGWTIGAHLNSLGDPSMLDDLRHGIKPAARVCYMMRHGLQSLNGKTRDQVKELLKEIKSDDWDYFAFKIGIWGMCYLMGPDLLATVIAKQSEGTVWKSRPEMYKSRDAVFAAYRLATWHTRTEHKLDPKFGGKPEIQTSVGHRRRFFARKQDRLGQALSHEPQFYTTNRTNAAMYRLWTDRENRIPSRNQSSRISLRCEPIHQVHDALITQFRKDDTAWATSKIKQWFDNPVIIAGQKITIPFDGKFGESWGNLKEGVI